MRLIDADALDEKLDVLMVRYAALGRRKVAEDYNFVRTVLLTAPTVDAVELPCKIGDTVWIARRYKCHKKPRWGVVSEMFFLDDMSLEIVVKGVARGKWGVHVFGTCEEAQAAIDNA